MNTVFADYQEQRSAFDELCKPTCEQSILLFEAEWLWKDRIAERM